MLNDEKDIKEYTIVQHQVKSVKDFKKGNDFQVKKSQVSIDLGSSQYIVAIKPETAETRLISLQGITTAQKIPSFACVTLQEALNSERLRPRQVTFGDAKADSSENVALMLNWKNYFFESQAKIRYPDCPTIPSNSNRSARVWISSIFEAFLYQAVVAGVKCILEVNSTCTDYIITMLIPSVDNDQHRDFLHQCFFAVLEHFIQENEIHDSEGFKFYFQLKGEAVAGVAYVLDKFKDLQKDDFIFADLGGFTSDFADVTHPSQKNYVVHKALNIAGNTIDIIRKMLINNQLSDVQISNQYKLHEMIRSIKETCTSGEIKVFNDKLFCDKAQLFVFVLQIVLKGLVKVSELSVKGGDLTKLNSVIQYITPFIIENLNNNFLLAEYTDAKQIEELKAKEFKANEVALQFWQLKDREDVIKMWIWDNLIDKSQDTIIKSYIQNQQQYAKNSFFMQTKSQLERQLKYIIEKKDNQISKDLKSCKLKICKDVLKALPLFTNYNQFIEYMNAKRKNSGLDTDEKTYVSIIDYLDDTMYFELWQQQKLTIFNDSTVDKNVIKYCNENGISKISKTSFAQSQNIVTKTEKNQENLKRLDQMEKISDSIKINMDMLNNQILVFNLFGLSLSDPVQMYQKVCEECGIVDKGSQYMQFDKILIQGISSNPKLKNVFIDKLFQFNECPFTNQLISNIAFAQTSKVYFIKSIQISEYPVLKFHEDILQSTIKVVTNKIIQHIQEISKNKKVVLSGGFVKESNFQDYIKQNQGSVHSIDSQELVLGGFENSLSSTIETEKKADIVVDQFAFRIDEGIKIETINPNQFKSNRLNIDQGTSGSQGFCAWANNTYQSFLSANTQLIDEVTIKNRTGSAEGAAKIPSFVILNITRLLRIAKQFGETYVYEDAQGIHVKENKFPSIFMEQQFSNQQIQEILSFESLSSNESIQIAKSSDQGQPQEKKQKLKKNVNKADNANKISCDLDIIESWKRNLYDIYKPEYPNNPCVFSKTVQNCQLSIPLSIIYTSQLLFFKQKYQVLLNDPTILANTTSITMTVPCGANTNHLHFVRCCCKAAGMGDNVSFVFEPVSAFAHICFSKKLSNIVVDESTFMKEGQYLVIDVGGGTTDLAYIQVIYQKGIPEFQLKYYYSILKAGNSIDTEFLSLINFEQLVGKNYITAHGRLQLRGQMNSMKLNNSSEDVMFGIQLNTNDMTKIQNTQTNIKNVILDSNNILNFQVAKSFMIQATQNVAQKIIDETIEFAMHAKIDLSQTSVVCAGGVGGSRLFTDIAKAKIYKTPTDAEKLFITIDPNTAQSSIPKGGVYLAEEKDHVNFNAQVIKIYKCDLKEIPLLANVKMQLQIRDGKFFTQPSSAEEYELLNSIYQAHDAEKEAAKEQKLPPKKYNTFDFENAQIVNENRYFRCACGIFGISLVVIIKNESQEVQANLFFPMDQLNQFETENTQNAVQRIYCGCMSVGPFVLEEFKSVEENEHTVQKLVGTTKSKLVVRVSCQLLPKGISTFNDASQSIYVNLDKSRSKQEKDPKIMEIITEEQAKELVKQEQVK